MSRVTKGQVVTVDLRGHELDRASGVVLDVIAPGFTAGVARVAVVHHGARDIPHDNLIPHVSPAGAGALEPGACVIIERDFPDLGVMSGQLGRVVRLGDGPRLGPVVIVSTPGKNGRVELPAPLDAVYCIGGPPPPDPGERGNRDT